eukprot:364649-Chlamydomonas_euryale.AAC.11
MTWEGGRELAFRTLSKIESGDGEATAVRFQDCNTALHMPFCMPFVGPLRATLTPTLLKSSGVHSRCCWVCIAGLRCSFAIVGSCCRFTVVACPLHDSAPTAT